MLAPEIRTNLKRREKGDRTATEQEKLKREFGADLKVKPIPVYLTPQIEMGIKSIGFKLVRYMPDFGFDEKVLREAGVENYLRRLSQSLPKLRILEELSPEERGDTRIMRNLQRRFWEGVAEGHIDLPDPAGGYWMAVEDMPKPAKGEKYEETMFGELMGYGGDRFGRNLHEVMEKADEVKEKLLRSLGLTGMPVDLRFLNALEYNFIANIAKLGNTNTFEGTKTEYYGVSKFDRGNWWNSKQFQQLGVVKRIIAGGSMMGGAGRIMDVGPFDSDSSLGYRFGLIFGYPSEKVKAEGIYTDMLSKRDVSFMHNCGVLGLKTEDLVNLPEGELGDKLKEAYYGTLKKNHPDLGGNLKTAQNITQAYRELRGSKKSK